MYMESSVLNCHAPGTASIAPLVVASLNATTFVTAEIKLRCLL